MTNPQPVMFALPFRFFLGIARASGEPRVSSRFGPPCTNDGAAIRAIAARTMNAHIDAAPYR